MVHMRLVAPDRCSDDVLDVLERTRSVINIVVLPGAARRPEGDVILCDVADEDASVIIEDLKHLGLPQDGSVAVERIDTAISRAAEDAERHASGAPADAVLWEEVESRTSEESTLSQTYLAFIVLAGLIAAVGIYLDSPILIVGAMVVGPEFGPIAGVCVGVVEKRRELALRSAMALAVGFPAAITGAWLATEVFQATGVMTDGFSARGHSFAELISTPDTLAFFVAFCAGVAGMLSLTTAKSGALIGVLISVTTIPAAANIGVSAAYGDWANWRGSVEMLALNVGSILLAGVATLYVQRQLYLRRRRRHRAHIGEVRPSSPARPTRRSSSARG